jgi:hypothetical protein
MATLDLSSVGIVGAIVAAGSAVTGWWAARAQNEKASAEAESVMVGSAERLVEMLSSQLDRMRDELIESQRRCEAEVHGLKLRIVSLERALMGAGVPIPEVNDPVTAQFPHLRRRRDDGDGA